MTRKINLQIGILFSSIILGLSSCISFNKGSIIQNNQTITKDNFAIVKTISGEAKATYILGFGGNKRNGLTKEAKENMYKSHQLSNNQNITNVTVDTKRQYFILPFIYNNETVIVSADVIQYYEYQIDEAKNNMQIIDENKSQNNSEEKIEKYADTTIYKSIKSMSEINVGSKIIVINSRGIGIEGIVTKIKTSEKLEYKFRMNNGSTLYDETNIWNVKVKLE